MSKTVNIQLSEAEYRELILCYTLGDLVKDTLEAKSKDEMDAQMQLHQKLYKAAYDAELKDSGLHNELYYYSKEVEDEMLQMYNEFKDFVD